LITHADPDPPTSHTLSLHDALPIFAGTAFGLLPFQAGGYTHKPAKNAQKDYSKSVAAALKFLIAKQGKDGYFGGDMYSHGLAAIDRKSTRLNSSHQIISYAVFCLKK